MRGVQSGSLTYEQFANIIGGKREFPDTKEDIMGAFHVMGDKAGTGKIDEKRMRAILTSFGSKLSQEEVPRRPRPTARARVHFHRAALRQSAPPGGRPCEEGWGRGRGREGGVQGVG